MEFENRYVSIAKSSPNMAVALAAKRLVAEGRQVVDLSLGEPDFEPPEHVREAACRAIMDGGIRYTAPAGLMSLREAIAEKLMRDSGQVYHPDDITVGNGAKQLLFNAFLVTLEPGDEVIVPTPCWSSYSDIVSINGGIPHLVKCDERTGYKLTPELLRDALSAKTRWLILNSPSNPTGAVYSSEDYLALAEVLESWPRTLVICDEIYEHIVFSPTRFASFSAACPQLRGRTLLINGVSKAYSMTGWRVGYAAGPGPLIKALNKVQSQSVTSVCSISQVAAETALAGPQEYITNAVLQYDRRRKLIIDAVSRIPSLSMVAPQGAFYGFVNVSRLYGCRPESGHPIADDIQLASYFLQHHGVATVPGSAFFSPNHIRLSFAASEDNLKKAMSFLDEMVNSLHNNENNNF